MASAKYWERGSTELLRESSSARAATPNRRAQSVVVSSYSSPVVSISLNSFVAGGASNEEQSNEGFTEFSSFQRASQFETALSDHAVASSVPSCDDNGTSSQPDDDANNRWRVVDISAERANKEIPATRSKAQRRPSSLSSFGTGSEKDVSPTSPSSVASSTNLPGKDQFLERFLAQIYDRTAQGRNFDSDTFTEASFSESFLSFVNCAPPSAECSPVRYRSVFAQPNSSAQCASDFEPEHPDAAPNALAFKRSEAQLRATPRRELSALLRDLQAHAQHVSSQLVRQVRRRDHAVQRRMRYCDVITAIVQATSPHRQIDRNLKFTIEPQHSHGENAFSRWKETMRAVVRLPCGMPPDFRRRMWLALADSHVCSIKVDWERTKRFAFNERQNPDDCALGLQIVKDLHRTGYSNFNGQDNEEDRAVLKRVLLGYARWNKHVGYCQGFNVIAALILDVVSRQEDEALKVFIYLIDHVLPESFFTNNLTALAVEMAVFRDLLKLYVPELSRHLEKLQQLARDSNSGNNYEPPLTNVFTMQWFLTLFATCLPHDTVLRLWDVIMLEGCETLLRAALAVWYKLRSHLRTVHSADEFYCLMGSLSQRLFENQVLTADELINVMFNICPSPIPNLAELREKYTYNITPFAPAAAQHGRTKTSGLRRAAESDGAIGCFTAMFADNDPNAERRRPLAQNDISRVGPGAFAGDDDDRSRALAAAAYPGHFAERMSTDVSALRKQYERLTQRHRQANVIITSAHRRYRDTVTNSHPNPLPVGVAAASTAVQSSNVSNVINHLLIGSSSSPALRQLTVTQSGTESVALALARPATNTSAVPVSPQVTPQANPLKVPAEWPMRNALKWTTASAISNAEDSHARRRGGSLESLDSEGAPQLQAANSRKTTPVGLVDRRAPRGPMLSLRDLAKRRSSLNDETPNGPIDDAAFRTMLANTIQEQRDSVSRETSVETDSVELSRKQSDAANSRSGTIERVSTPNNLERNGNGSGSGSGTATRNAPDFATLETSVLQQPNAHVETYERIRGANPQAERRPFNLNQPNPSSLQRIRKMNMNACLQRGYMADMHNVQQAQRRKMYS